MRRTMAVAASSIMMFAPACSSPEQKASIFLDVDCKHKPFEADAIRHLSGTAHTDVLGVRDNGRMDDVLIPAGQPFSPGGLVARVGRVVVFNGMPNPQTGQIEPNANVLSAVCEGTDIKDLQGQIGGL